MCFICIYICALHVWVIDSCKLQYKLIIESESSGRAVSTLKLSFQHLNLRFLMIYFSYYSIEVLANIFQKSTQNYVDNPLER